ncbi:MAG: DUF1934 domain-containing protein [Oscillospiraceae bacterium]|nr:DUF1934 domain-containing protein [Oscillospiraceae bacterium]
MLKDVWISINSIHGYEQDNEDHVEFTTDGYYYYEDGIGCLSYEESEVTGLEGTRTSMIVMPDQVVVDRDGLITSRMIFKEGLKNSFLYETPYGNATMGIDTRKIFRSMDENGGKVEIDYVLDVEHAVVARNKFQITVKETENRGSTNG